METTSVPEEAKDKSYEKFIPWLTIAMIATCLILFGGINSEAEADSWESYRKWGYLSSIPIYNGEIWGLLTCNFLHLDFIHLLLNLYWLWIFGKKIEFEKGIPFLLFLTISSGFLASIYQLSIGGETGIGFSGIGYAMFGYLYIQSRYQEKYKEFLDNGTIQLFIIWLFVCIFLTYFDIYHIANAAHFSGFLWGIYIAFGENKFKTALKYFILIPVFLLSFIPVYWAPWSVSWLSIKAYEQHEAKNNTEALSLYQSILEKDPTNSFALGNKKIIEVYNLSQQAQKALQENKIDLAKTYLIKITEIDSSDQWSRDLLRDLTK